MAARTAKVGSNRAANRALQKHILARVSVKRQIHSGQENALVSHTAGSLTDTTVGRTPLWSLKRDLLSARMRGQRTRTRMQFGMHLPFGGRLLVYSYPFTLSQHRMTALQLTLRRNCSKKAAPACEQLATTMHPRAETYAMAHPKRSPEVASYVRR
jgi:hypothetical protein